MLVYFCVFHCKSFFVLTVSLNTKLNLDLAAPKSFQVLKIHVMFVAIVYDKKQIHCNGFLKI